MSEKEAAPTTLYSERERLQRNGHFDDLEKRLDQLVRDLILVALQKRGLSSETQEEIVEDATGRIVGSRLVGKIVRSLGGLTFEQPAPLQARVGSVVAELERRVEKHRRKYPDGTEDPFESEVLSVLRRLSGFAPDNETP